ncbi:hypothetical protein [Futiania mangrovi]|uniref:Type III secretion protein n=1 Tax=Futiania mangrovi TaxID=2959716 RepID=A0A9J6PDS4_9PROT|nr:hypothetical protein [Futiania mangrovii]MCP1336801.1 hypothetical protein [Futiania mangrovii]
MSPKDVARLVQIRRERAEAARDALARVRKAREGAQAAMAAARRALAAHEQRKPEILNALYTAMVGRPVTPADWTAIEVKSAALEAEGTRLAGMIKRQEEEVHRLMGEEQEAKAAEAAVRKALSAVEEVAGKVRNEHARAALQREEQEIEEIAQDRFAVARLAQK